MKQQTCIRLPADLLKQLKIRAIEEGAFVNSLVERAVRDLLSGPQPQPVKQLSTPAMPAPQMDVSKLPAMPETPRALGGLFAQFAEANE